jgi:hypothetical protein
MRTESVGESPRVVVHGADGVGDDIGYRLGVLVVVEEVRGNPRGSRHGQTA